MSEAVASEARLPLLNTVTLTVARGGQEVVLCVVEKILGCSVSTKLMEKSKRCSETLGCLWCCAGPFGIALFQRVVVIL